MKKYTSRKELVRNQGFTLIELLVVIAIIGILASIVVASLNVARQKSRDARRIADIKQLQNALELYYDSQTTPEYPPATTVCDDTHSFGLEVLVTGGQIPTMPRDPNAHVDGTPNCYLYTSNSASPRKAYHLGATLEDSANPVLNYDKDCDSTDNNPVCSAGATYGPTGTPPAGPFDGAADALYDVVP